MTILFFFCLLASIQSIRVMISEIIDHNSSPNKYDTIAIWFFHILTVVLWTIFYHLN